jgi:hypothetical protein
MVTIRRRGASSLPPASSRHARPEEAPVEDTSRPAAPLDDADSDNTGNTFVEDDRQMIEEEQADEREAEAAVDDLTPGDG